ncbi:hypothetical protein WMF37_45560 [Sorangium sp. So ce291]|uniref:hypothetical protein n=1 Tax=Sorangium sp. So ce291 TaxID=3133294 RepID=UPI003F634F43
MATDKKNSRRQDLASVFVPGTDPLAFAPAAVTTLAAQLAGFTAEPQGYDPGGAEDLVATCRPRLTAITPDRLEVPRLDIEPVCRALLTVHALTQAPPLLALYRGAAAQGEFQLDNLEHLKALALILLHAYRQADAAGAFSSGARLSAVLDKESAEVESRLQKVCEHFCGDDPARMDARQAALCRGAGARAALPAVRSPARRALPVALRRRAGWPGPEENEEGDGRASGRWHDP